MTADVVVELLATMWQLFSNDGADTPSSLDSFPAPILCGDDEGQLESFVRLLI